MDLNFVLILCIALIFAAVKVDGEGEVVTNSNLTNSRFGGSEIVANTNVTDSKNITDDAQLDGDNGSKVKGSEEDSSNKSEVDKRSDDNTKEEVEGVSNSSMKKKEGVHGEDCDPSNMCTDEEDQFVACLRVPGNDAPHLSLLIQNKGKSSLLVTITAPGFVRLEKNKVQLLENEDTKVKVSVNKGRSNDSAIILTSSKGRCRLELKELTAAHETGNDDNTDTVSRPSVFNIRPRTIIAITMISFLVLSLVIIPVIVHVYRTKTQGKHKYQRIDMELPVSNNAVVTKSEHESGDDGWNNNWGDDWDDENGDGDEEQPNTPVLPLTPSVSARGLAPRRLSKEGWKD